MPRLHLFEFEDLPRFPTVWRELSMELLAFNMETAGAYEPIVSRLADALRRAGSSQILDLCSGASGTSLWVFERVAEELGEPLEVLLTDKYPHVAAFERLAAGRPGCEFSAEPVDALAVPPELKGFRTMFTAFHHFRPEQAAQILQDAVDQRAPIGVFEFTERHPLPVMSSALLLPLIGVVNSLRMRPLTARRLLWALLLPVVPLAVTWDGVVSNLRSYEPEELGELVDGLAQTAAYTWDIGRTRRRRDGFCVTYLIGVPRSARK